MLSGSLMGVNRGFTPSPRFRLAQFRSKGRVQKDCRKENTILLAIGFALK